MEESKISFKNDLYSFLYLCLLSYKKDEARC